MQKISNKLLSWASIIEPNTQAQAELTSSMPFVQPHLALMPDAHLGKGATVGSVIPTAGAIMPAAVGVDIGCGMIAVRTQFTRSDVNQRVNQGKPLATLRQAIERSIPLSAGSYNQRLTETAAKRVSKLTDLAEDRAAFYESLTRTPWPLHLGTLGSGNHFIEVTLDEADSVWLFLHSGSRGIGNSIAMHHIKVSQDLMRRYFITLADMDLAYLVEGTPEFDSYITDLNWAQEFALLNREEMMDRLARCFSDYMAKDVLELDRINCHHNFTQKENHMGRNMWISRKGAIQADEGQPGLIPGSMGTASYVVSGLGNPSSFHSSPHGAGRLWARNAAKRKFTLEDMDASMQGIEYRRSAEFLDEIPAAYKDIDVVMADAGDLVRVEHTLHQIVNVKGT